MAYCINCGEKLVDGSKFCHSCGTPVTGNSFQDKSQRHQEYVGKILKCSHCGGVITETTAICPNCGMQITGRSAVSSVQAFKEQLMTIESERKRSNFIEERFQTNPTDTQKLTLIRSFPIPNTVDDIKEFILLAMANIDTRLSKQTTVAKLSGMLNSTNANLSIQKTISDAWVSKMQQAYHKAEISFPNEAAFDEIKKMYYAKLKELKIIK